PSRLRRPRGLQRPCRRDLRPVHRVRGRVPAERGPAPDGARDLPDLPRRVRWRRGGQRRRRDGGGGMSGRSMAEALAPLRARMPQVVREQEILRVLATMPDGDPVALVSEAQRQVLVWAQNRAGARLPQEAWQGDSFELLSGGRTTFGIHLSTVEGDIWAVRVDDPDKTVAGRTWTTE